MPTATEAKVQAFLASPAFAVLGASRQRSKYGNKVLRCYQQHRKKVYPIHPNEAKIEGLSCLRSIADLPADVASLSVITPPAVTTALIAEAIAKKTISHIWMQPGAESREAIASCQAHGIEVIAGGPCLLVVLGFNEFGG